MTTPPNPMVGVKTKWELRLFQGRPLVSPQRLQMGIFGFLTERDWSRKSCYDSSNKGVFVSFVMHICDPPQDFKEKGECMGMEK